MAFALLCSLSMWAQVYPDHFWMIGSATSAGWDLSNAVQMTVEYSGYEPTGIYTWKGELQEGELKFTVANFSWDNEFFYGPTTNQESLVSGEHNIENLATAGDKKFYVSYAGTYRLTFDMTSNKLTVGYNNISEPGHFIYFHNSGSAWGDVWLRIGRNDHVYAHHFTRLGESDWWQCPTPDYENYTFFTIMDREDHTAPVADYPDGTNRLYEYNYDLKENRWYTLTDGPHANDNHFYWNNTSDVNPQIVMINEYAGHTIYFDNSVTQWEQPYFRIGRSQATNLGDYASARPFIRLDESDIWYIETENWENAEVWTITSPAGNSGDGACVYNLPNDAERLHYYHDHIGVSKFVVATGSKGGSGPYYWNGDVTNAYSRDVTAGNYGTICLPKAAYNFTGAEMYRLIDKTAANGIVIETVDAMNAGEPYIFRATSSKLMVVMEGDEEAAKTVNGLVGYIGAEDKHLLPDGDKLYILKSNQIWMVDTEVIVPSNRAYIDMSGINTLAPVPARKRCVIDSNHMPTGIENQMVNGEKGKFIKDGQLFILRGDHTYNAQGQMVQ